MTEKLTLKDISFKIRKVDLSSRGGLELIYMINVGQAFLPNGQEVELDYPKFTGNPLYNMTIQSYEINTPVNALLGVDNEYNTEFRTDSNEELAQTYLDILKQVCKETNIFYKTFTYPKELKTSNYMEGKNGISLFTDSLFNGKILTSIEEYKKFIKMFTQQLEDNGLMSSIKLSAKAKTKIKKLLDSLYPVCDIEIKQPEGTVDINDFAPNVETVKSSRIGLVLSKINKRVSISALIPNEKYNQWDYFLDLIANKPYLHILDIKENKDTDFNQVSLLLEVTVDTNVDDIIEYLSLMLKYDIGAKGVKVETSAKKVKIPVKNEGILEVPEGKNVEDLPLSHFEKLVESKGYDSIIKALNNLQVFNKHKNVPLSRWASNMMEKLKKVYGSSRIARAFNKIENSTSYLHNVNKRDLKTFINLLLSDEEFDLSLENPDDIEFIVHRIKDEFDIDTNSTEVLDFISNMNEKMTTENSASDYSIAKEIIEKIGFDYSKPLQPLDYIRKNREEIFRLISLYPEKLEKPSIINNMIDILERI